MNILSFKRILGFVLISIIFYFGVILYGDINQINQNFSVLDFRYIPAILSMVVVSIFLKSLRQKYLLQRENLDISVKDSVSIFCSGLAFLMTPGAIGTFAKSFFMKEKYGFQLSKTISVIIAERIFDLVGISGLVIIFMSFRFVDVLFLPITLFVILLIGFIFLASRSFFTNRITNVLKKLIKQDGFEISFKNILTRKNIFTLTVFSIGCWFLDAVAFYLSFSAFITEINFFDASIIGLSSLVAGFLTLIPGGIGITEVSLINLLIQYNLDYDLATTATIFSRICTVWFATVLGIFFVIPLIKK
ncbi:flippase-like domain-containing protein [Nitrosopumilus sp. K4]|uniref:lysylphosphatidylglycerol synthase transmembrane domain-containing protein n=1 Tax=Nitrosopumilus sp. K4 TaxID=2795383 RepID=UPI001BA8595C|nr:lysylphosphatidylglycerol synthase transmembrane domain-containing protein [Nitrosopumilus sp. K4]QUC64788.1 flippase-like domain-containing protein [Nitrosopumilus sp. K4]